MKAMQNIAGESLTFVTEDEIIISLLKEWGLEELGNDLKSAGIDLEVLKIIQDDDIRELIPKEKLGLRVKFKKYLNEWRIQNGFSSKSITLHDESIESTISNSVQSWLLETSTKSPRSDTPTLNLKNTLEDSVAGKAILNEYTTTKRLSLSSRGTLTTIIIDYWLSEKLPVLKSTFVNAAEEIQSIFPSENKEIYYIPRSGNIAPRGKLVDKYYSRSRKYQKLGLIKSRYRERSCTPSSSKHDEEIYEDVNDEKQIQAKLWLKTNSQPESIVNDKWNLSFPVRRLDVLNPKLDVLEEWPTFKIPSGYIYVELDFERLFPQIDILLFSKWPNFTRKIAAIFERNIKDASSRELCTLLNGDSNEDTKNYIICILLSSILIPKVLHFKKDGKKVAWKPSILDAQTGFALHARTPNDVNILLEGQRKKYTELNTTLQPCIVVIGDSRTSLREFRCCFNGVQYIFPSFLKALSVTFKIHQVLSMHYASECCQVWNFFEEYFYEMKASSKRSPSLIALISDLNEPDAHNI